MNPRTLFVAGFLCLATLFIAYEGVSHAVTPKPKFAIGTAVIKVKGHAAKQLVYPDTPCNVNHRMDIAIVDGMFWECTCVRLYAGYQCDWMLIAGVAKQHKRRIVIHVPLPAVVR